MCDCVFVSVCVCVCEKEKDLIQVVPDTFSVCLYESPCPWNRLCVLIRRGCVVLCVCLGGLGGAARGAGGQHIRHQG